MYAAMLETDYAKKAVFNKNFWEGFQSVLGRGHQARPLPPPPPRPPLCSCFCWPLPCGRKLTQEMLFPLTNALSSSSSRIPSFLAEQHVYADLCVGSAFTQGMAQPHAGQAARQV